MADEQALPVDAEQVTEPTPEAIETKLSAEELVKAEIDRVSAQYKKELQGLNRRNSELEKILEEQKKATMDEAEKREYEMQQWEQKLAAKEQEITRTSNKDKAVKFAADNGLDMDYLETMTFDNWDVVESNLNTLKAVVDRSRDKIIEEFKTTSGHSPAPGGGAAPGMVGISALKGKSPEVINAMINEGRVDFKR